MDGGYYIGHTQDLTERLERHNQGRVKYCKRNPPNPPFLKGDRGGFCCAVVFPKTTAAHSVHKQS